MNPVATDILMHYGVKRRSGRYPWGSGDNPYQHSGDFLSRVQELKSQGLSEKEIVEAMGLDSSTQYRVAYRTAKNERRRLQVARAKSLREDGLNNSDIAREMGINESSVRSLLDDKSEARMNAAENTAAKLKEELTKKKMLDVGASVETELGVSRQALEEAIFMLEAEGYQRFGVGVAQAQNTSQRTTITVLARPDITQAYAYNNVGEIESVGEYHSSDGGRTFDKREYPASVDSSRVSVCFAEEGGSAKDGVIELRRGVADLDLGRSHYAQVRIMVDGTHYLKGMAMYADDLPEGTDIRFNTSKSSKLGKMGVLKEIEPDPDNPFGAYIKANGQSWYDAPDGTRKLSAINKLKEEGEWDTMSKNLSSQFLSKQPMPLIKRQLKLTYDDAASEYADICALTNPTLKRKYLLEFADSCDAKASHLKAAALPGQSTRVILPVTALSDSEVYAPYLKTGQKVALVRYPHAGTFEIPELTVNNKNRSAKSILGDATDAIGINPHVAARLSGADFDGDFVVVIPLSDKVRVKSTPALKELEGFDPREAYPYREGMKVMTKGMKGREMGVVSNLITDMTLQGAPTSEIVRAVRHSMVVIDAQKHKLDYKQSELDNGIAELKSRYQGGGGAATLISKRKHTVQVPERQGSGIIDPETGKVSYRATGRTYIDKNGKRVAATTKINIIEAHDDAFELSSGTEKEAEYATYINKMKALANQARKEYRATARAEYSASAAQAYKTEVDKLKADLNLAEKNRPKERRAQIIANSVVKAKLQEYPDIRDDKKEVAKIRKAAIDDARYEVGASGKDTRITITDIQWEAIQSGAITDSTLTRILKYTDPDDLRARAMPRQSTQVSSAKQSKIQSMSASGYTIAEIADACGLSTSTVSGYIRAERGE